MNAVRRYTIYTSPGNAHGFQIRGFFSLGEHIVLWVYRHCGLRVLIGSESSEWAIPVKISIKDWTSVEEQQYPSILKPTSRNKRLLIRLVDRLFWANFGGSLTATILWWKKEWETTSLCCQDRAMKELERLLCIRQIKRKTDAYGFYK